MAKLNSATITINQMFALRSDRDRPRRPPPRFFNIFKNNKVFYYQNGIIFKTLYEPPRFLKIDNIQDKTDKR